jgi:hypothetical protein
VINLVGSETLADQYGLPRAPAKLPPVGDGKVFVQVAYRRWLAAAVLLAVLLALHGTVLSGLPCRVRQYIRRRRYPTPDQAVESPSVPELQLMV